MWSSVAKAQFISDYGIHLFVGQNDLVGKFQENEKAKGIYSFTAGFHAHVDLPAHFVFRAELNALGLADSLVRKTNLVISGVTNGTNSRIKSSRYYLQLPLILRFCIPSEETNLQLNVGVYGAYLLSHRENGSIVNSQVGTGSVDYVNSKSYYALNHVEWGYVFSISGQNDRTTYEFRFTKSATPLFTNFPFYAKYNFGYMIGLGYSFN